MTEVSVDSAERSHASRSWIDCVLCGFVWRRLKKLDDGQLVMEDGAERREFGRPGEGSPAARIEIRDPRFYRHLVFGIIGPDAGYAEARAVLDSILRELGLKGQYRPVEHPTFIKGRCAQVDIDNGLWARLGELHPQVLNNFNLTYPLALCELRFAKIL